MISFQDGNPYVMHGLKKTYDETVDLTHAHACFLYQFTLCSFLSYAYIYLLTYTQGRREDAEEGRVSH